MAHLYRLIVIGLGALLACVVLLVPLRAHASFPATPVEGACTSNCYQYRVNSSHPWNPSASGACQYYVSQVSSWTYLGVGIGGSPYGSYASCRYRNEYGQTVEPGMSVSSRAPDPSPYTCPANATLSGSQCTCNSGFIQQGSSCVPEPTQQELLCQSLNGTSSYGSAPGRTGPGASTCTATGCAGSFAGTVLVITDKQGVTRTEGDITFNGSTCTYNPEAGAVEKPCQGQQGEVNGVTVCVPYSDKTNVIESVSNDSNSVSDSDSSKNKSESTQKSTKCEGNTCTTTTTTTYNYNGTTGTRSETKTESKDDFCSKNPAATQCKGGNFGGSCSGGFTCDGDAVQCAIAREQHKRACSLFDAASSERTLYEESKGATGNQAPTVPGVAITSSSFDTSNALGAAACLVDVPVTIANHQVTVPFSKVCPHLDMLKAVLIAVSLLLALRIVSRG